MENFKREIFEKLGDLFYALAADQRVSMVSSGELKMLVKKDWLTERTEHSEDRVSEAAHLIGLSIDVLQNEKTPAESAYSSFRDFYGKHREQFSSALKQKILETSESIVKMFRATGQKNPHLEDLRRLLKLSRENTEARI